MHLLAVGWRGGDWAQCLWQGAHGVAARAICGINTHAGTGLGQCDGAAVSSWVALSERYGKLPFAALFESAIQYAEHGFLVGPKSAFYWQLLEHYYDDYPDWYAHFGPAPKAGQRFKRPDMAHSLRLIRDSKGEDFYRGELAQLMVSASAQAGGALSLADLDQHRCEWVTPTRQSYHGVELLEIPPNGQGLAAQIALGILAHLPVLEMDSCRVHQQIEAMKIAVHAANEHFADPDAMFFSPEELERALWLGQRRVSVSRRRLCHRCLCLWGTIRSTSRQRMLRA